MKGDGFFFCLFRYGTEGVYFIYIKRPVSTKVGIV